MAIVEFLNGEARTDRGKFHGYKTHASMKRVIEYITDPAKTREDLIKGFNCAPQNAYDEFMTNKLLWGKAEEGGERRMVIHFTQSFHPEDNVTPEMASEIADKLLQHEFFRGFQVVYATHLDTGKLHTHFVVDTVNKDTGKMWNLSTRQLEELKDYSDQLCREYKLSICKKREDYTVPHQRKNEIMTVKKGESWKEEIRIKAMLCSKEAVSRQDYIHKMKELGVTVNWTDQRKYITFIDDSNNKQRVRNTKLEPVEAFTKEALMKQFEINRQYQQMMKEQEAENRKESAEAYQSVRSLLYIAKTLMKAADRPYPLQNSAEFHRLGTKDAMKDYMAEQEKGRGVIERV